MIFSGEYLGARKMDGAYYRFTCAEDGEMKLQGRSRSVSGSFLNKIGHVPHLIPFFNSLPKGTCLLGELYFPNKEGSQNVTTIMGCKEDKAIKRQEEGDKLHYYIFDVWAWNGESFLNKSARERFSFIMNRGLEFNNNYVEFPFYYSGEKLWDELNNILNNGGEGIVMTKQDSFPQPGKRTARKTLKVKKEIAQNIDCFFTGKITAPTKEYTGKEIESWPYWINSKTEEVLPEGNYFKEYRIGKMVEPVTKPYYNKWAGSVEIGVFDNNGKVKGIGYLSGLNDEIKANIEKYKMKPIEVSAMEILPTGGLRHAKFVGFRPDLSLEDCTINKII